MTPKGIELITTKFRQMFQEEPLMVRSPGRINLIGEHTDYNQGLVLPAAVDKEIILALAGNGTDECRLYAYDLGEEVSFDINDIPSSSPGWPAYLIGVVDQMVKANHKIKGFDCLFGGDIPIGSGLSSSAALECGLAFGLNHLFDLDLEKRKLAFLSQKAENHYVGVQCGIMDQFANLFGKTNHAIKLDCRSLDYQYFELNLIGYRLILFDTQVKHNLADSEYNQRKLECERGVAIIKKKEPTIDSLRDCSPEMIEGSKTDLGPLLYRRCRFIIEENGRVEAACADLLTGNIEAFGERMYASHQGLRHDYEVSCSELDFLVDQTQEMGQVVGARMMGGGFGGCTINLIKDENVDALVGTMQRLYKKNIRGNLKTYKIKIGSGTSLIKKVSYSI